MSVLGVTFWEWYLGLPAVSAGQGTEWSLTWRPPWPVGWPLWAVAVLAVLIAVSVGWTYQRDAARLSRWPRVCLAALRFLALGWVLVLATQPGVSISRTGLPSVAVLLDASGSMQFPDAGSLPASGDKSSVTRWSAIRAVVTAQQGEWLKRLANHHPLRLYQFSETASALGPGEIVDAESVGKAVDAILQTQPNGEQTRLAPAVTQVLSETRGRPPTAIIIFTDGIASESDQDKLSTVAEDVRRRGSQLIVVPVGSAEVVRDLQLFDVMLDDVAFVGDPVLLSGRIRATGYGGKRLTVRVRQAESDQILAQQELTLPQEDGATRFELTLTPDTAGELPLIVEAVPLPQEAQTDNNSERRRIAVRDEQLRVLLVESAPRYEFRYLKQWLERDKSVQLQTLLLEADPEYAQEDRTALANFPVQRDELFRYDVVVLGDVSPTRLGASASEWIASFVREKGGGVILVSGPRANPSTFAGSPWESLLPFELKAWNASDERSFTEPVLPRLTLDGQKGVSLFRLAETEALSLQVWQRLPGIYWHQEVQRVKPSVRVLAEHPLTSFEGQKAPLITLQQIGSGKVLWHATDELWRWRFRAGDEYYGRYWSQALRYLCRSRLIGQDRTAELIVDRQIYRRGEPVSLRVRFLDEQFAPTSADGVRVVLEQQGGGRRELSLSRLSHLPTVFETQVTPTNDGEYQAWIARPTFTGTAPSAEFRIESPQRELARKVVDRADLELAAKRSGGRLVTIDKAPEIPAQIPPGRAVTLTQGDAIPLWSRWEPLLLLMALLTAEWVLRRRWRLV